ncbi:MAG: hypothetical protein CMJ89_15110 [Planctomycetes bacterium]|jgi:hypothetical protein|nr:hypothetical protein [Planctomycetota bacterium]
MRAVFHFDEERARNTPCRFLAVLCFSALCLSACYSQLQRLPGPLPPLKPPPEEPPVSAIEALVQRHSDPVWIRRPGALDDYPLPYYRKRERVTAGTIVRTGYGGRAELIWPGDASNVVLFDNGAVRITNPETDEVLVEFLSVSRCLLHLTPEDRVVLPGGSVLRGDSVHPSGPFLLEEFDFQYLRLTNQTKLSALLRYREAEVELVPGESVDLPRLGDTAPRSDHPASEELLGGRIRIVGRVQPSVGQGVVRLRATRPTEIFAQGIKVRLAPEEEVFLEELSSTGEFPTDDTPGKDS